MRRGSIFLVTILLAGPGACFGQAVGNIGYSQGGGKAQAELRERNKRVLTSQELPTTGTSTFVEAGVLMNVKPDEFVAVFGIAIESKTVSGCNDKMDATVKEFLGNLKTLGAGGDDVFLDFVAQNKIYGYEISGDIAREKLVGFELKKNVVIHYRDRALLDKLVVTAARSEVYDLVKVDTLVNDPGRVKDRLMEEAARVVKHKKALFETLLDVKLQPPAQVFAERTGVYHPTELYDSYTAHESEQMGAVPDRQKYTTQAARKSRTFFFNGLDGDSFDAVINPVITEPVVQFTLYLKVKYEVEQAKAR